jgi:hypothetical protein
VGTNRSRRGRRTKRPPSTRRGAAQGWELTHSPYSPAGEIEGAQRFARGFSFLPPGRRRSVRIVVLVVLVPFAVGILGFFAALSGIVGSGSTKAGTLAGTIRFTGGPVGQAMSTPQEGFVTVARASAPSEALALHAGPNRGFSYRFQPGDYLLRAQVGQVSVDACPPVRVHVSAGHTTHADVVCRLG